MKIMVLFWSTSVEKDSNIVPSLFFSHFFGGLLLFFSLAFLFFLGTMLYEWWSSHFYLFTTQWLQLDTRTKYDSIWMPQAVYRDINDAWVTYMKELWTVALPQLKCQLHDHAKQYDNDECVMINGTVESCMKYISEWLWKCHDRYVWWLFWGRYMVYDTGERCAVLDRLAMVEGWECV